MGFVLSTQPKDFHFDHCLPCSGPAWGLNLDDLDPLGHASSWTEPLSEAAKEEVEEMPRKLQTAGGICWNNHHVGTDAKSHSRDFDILVLVKCWVFFGCFLCASGQICTGSFSERHFNLFSALHRLSHIVLYVTIGYQSMWFLKLTMMIDDVISITFHVPPAPWSKRLPRWARCQRGDELLENLAADSYDDVSAEVMPWTILGSLC